MKHTALILLCLAALAACAEEPRPAAQQLSEGYNAHQMQEHVWEVKVGGTGHPADKVQRMALWRSAKLTLDQGRDKFKIIGGSGVSSGVGTVMTQPTAIQQTQVIGTGPQAAMQSTGYYVPAQPVQTIQAGGDVLIKIFRNNEMDASGGYYDARQVMQMYGAEFAGMK